MWRKTSIQALDSELNGVCGHECKGGGEDAIACEKEMRRLQLLTELNCKVTSTWTNNDDNSEYHVWRAWGSRVHKKQLDCIVGPRDLCIYDVMLEQSSVAYLGPLSRSGEN